MTPRAALGDVHPGDVGAGFMVSALGAFAHEAGTRGVPFAVIAESCPSGDLPDARNRVTAHFLDHRISHDKGGICLREQEYRLPEASQKTTAGGMAGPAIRSAGGKGKG